MRPPIKEEGQIAKNLKIKCTVSKTNSGFENTHWLLSLDPEFTVYLDLTKETIYDKVTGELEEDSRVRICRDIETEHGAETKLVKARVVVALPDPIW